MKFNSCRKIILSCFVLVFAFAGFSCQKAQISGNQAAANQDAVKAASPTEAYKMLFAAVKAKDTARIRQLLSKNSMNLAGIGAKQFGNSIEKQIENGMQATTFADALPPVRDERVKGNFGAVEVFNQKTNRWDETAFILEDGGWRLAAGDQVSGTYQSPGKGQAQMETEAANTSGNNLLQLATNANGKSSATGGEKVKTVEVPIEKENKKPVDKEKK